MRTGKHPAKNDYRTLRMANYIPAGILPPPPIAYSALDRALRNVGGTVADLMPLYANDRYGDCTIAALVHAASLWHAIVGKKYVTTDASVIKFYMKMTGGVDSGLAELDVLNYWRQHVISQDQILAYVRVDPHNHVQVKQAIQMFGCLYIGFQCQEAVQDDFQAGRTWTPGPLTQDGHAVVATAYDADTLDLLTWGAVQKGTWDWWDLCVDEAYAILPPEAQQPTFDPGFSLNQLKVDLMQVAS